MGKLGLTGSSKNVAHPSLGHRVKERLFVKERNDGIIA